jgi:phosphatidylinositol alpha-mannosyltransferase
MIMVHLGADAVVIPNGVTIEHYRDAPTLPDWPRHEPGEPRAATGGVIGFIGRYDEPRKGMTVLLAALETLVQARPELRLLVAGRGEEDDFLRELAPALRDNVVMLGQVSEAQKASLLRSVDVYVALNTGGESFGIILLEAMAACTPIVASDLDAFRRVLDDGRAGVLFANRDSAELAVALERVLADPALRDQLAFASAEVVRPYDWAVIARQILRVYEIAIAGAVRG